MFYGSWLCTQKKVSFVMFHVSKIKFDLFEHFFYYFDYILFNLLSDVNTFTNKKRDIPSSDPHELKQIMYV